MYTQYKFLPMSDSYSIGVFSMEHGGNLTIVISYIGTLLLLQYDYARGKDLHFLDVAR